MVARQGWAGEGGELQSQRPEIVGLRHSRVPSSCHRRMASDIHECGGCPIDSRSFRGVQSNGHCPPKLEVLEKPSDGRDVP